MKNKFLIAAVSFTLLALMLLSVACGSSTTSSNSPAASAAPSSTVQPSASTVPSTSAAPTGANPTPTSSATSATASATSTSTATATTTSSSSSDFKIELSFTTSSALTMPQYSIMLIPWSQEITKETGGRVTFKFYPSETLVKQQDAYDAVVKNLVDMSYAPSTAAPGRFPYSEVFSLPLLSASKTVDNTAIIQQVYKDQPALQKEYADAHLVSIMGTVPYQIHTTKKPVRALQDLKGLRLGGPSAAQVLPSSLGAIPVQVTSGEFYSALDKGVIDGLVVPWGVVQSQGCSALTRYHTICNIGAASQWSSMNLSTWNKLPPDIQQVFDDIRIDQPQYWPAVTIAQEKTAIDASNKLGYTIINLSPDEMAKWFGAVEDTYTKWVNDKVSAGQKDAQAVLDETIQLTKKYQALEASEQ